MPKDLYHPVYGKVVDGESDRSVVCEGCRCELVSEVDWKDTIEMAKEILANLKKYEKDLEKLAKRNRPDKLLDEWDDEWEDDDDWL